eukprot:gnl/TRDRNA2_/TRDRNA2_175786_c0_seq2.p2 gnl/TRDRNA2_/TRDRNA2_175786_c0~~gnl/TRDRNA2_/TRDRNA2_175786_c0_seq2.p2  ORF type:complete len:159 (-),score=13.51 gnl/TRDRNA2_/TRDRNA2_175786_c0_seq2:34-510(-)
MMILNRVNVFHQFNTGITDHENDIHPFHLTLRLGRRDASPTSAEVKFAHVLLEPLTCNKLPKRVHDYLGSGVAEVERRLVYTHHFWVSDETASETQEVTLSVREDLIPTFSLVDRIPTFSLVLYHNVDDFFENSKSSQNCQDSCRRPVRVFGIFYTID